MPQSVKSFIFALLFSAPLFGQQWELKDSIVISIKDSITDFGSDDFNNIYFIRTFSQLNKLNLNGKQLRTFSNQSVLENLNTDNILRITLKSDFFSLLILDNELNLMMSPIGFPEEGRFMPMLIAVVDNNYLWGYDPVMQRLVLWNYREKRIIRQSVILNETGDEFYKDLIYYKNKIYLIGPEKILRFDEFAQLERASSFREFSQIQISGNDIYFSHQGELMTFNQESGLSTGVEIPGGFDYFSLNSHYLFVLKGKVVYIYKPQKNL